MRLKELAEMVELTPAALNSAPPLKTLVFAERAVIDAPVAVQRQYVQLLQTLREPVGAAFTTVVAGERAPTSRGVQDTEAKLGQVLPEVRLDNIGLEAAINQLRDATRANLVVDWLQLENAGIDRALPVTLHVWDVPLSKVLDLLLGAAGGDTVRLGYRAEDGVVHITTGDALATVGVTTRIYDVRPLIVDYVASNAELDELLARAIAPRGRPTTAPVEELVRAAREDAIEQIATLIRDYVEPDGWRENGGSIGSMREWAGHFLIAQTPENHRSIEELLKQLRGTLVPGGLDTSATTRPATSPVAPPSPRRPAGEQALFGHG
jgi:hypothetical protein